MIFIGVCRVVLFVDNFVFVGDGGCSFGYWVVFLVFGLVIVDLWVIVFLVIRVDDWGFVGVF